mmetsp:Transcript_38201/g.61619  ORF Transcript_38201/g.61619 Transcript_38201/m.61619 type:complete len:165 (-) Transcript_38201:230-724(-)
MPRRHARRSAASVAALAVVAAAFSLAVGRPSSLACVAPGAGQESNFALRICEKCISRRAGNGYNPTSVLRQTAAGAAAAGWPAPKIQMGKCTGGCDFGPNVRVVKGEYAIPVTVDGMTEDEIDFKTFLAVNSEEAAERAFGLTSRFVAMQGQAPAEEEVNLPEP